MINKQFQQGNAFLPYLILVVIAGLITTNLWLYFWGQEAMTPSKIQPIVIDTNWETYTNETFSFQYLPSRWTINEPSKINYGNVTGYRFNVKDSVNSQSAYIEVFPILIDANIIENYLSDKNFAANVINDSKLITQKTVANIKTSEYCGIPGHLTYCETPVYHAAQLYVIGKIDDGTANTVYDTILSTFRFTDDVSDWQTYTNSLLHYEIKYPKDWHIWYDGAEEEMYLTIGDYPSESPHMNSFGSHIQIDTDLENYDMKRANPSLQCTNEQHIKINNYDAISYKCVSSISSESFERYLLSNNGSTFDISVAISPNKNTFIYKQILSTFRFTDDMSDWKTYTNEVYSFKYPPKDWAVEQIDNGIWLGSTRRWCDPICYTGFNVELTTTTISNFILEYNESSPYSQIKEEIPYVLNDISGTRLIGTTDIGIDEHYFFFKKDKKTYIMNYKDALKPLETQILSTFKFIK